MKNFEHVTAKSFEEASDALVQHPGSVAIAGGSDLLDVLKKSLFPWKPGLVVDLKRIQDADKIKVDGDKLNIGALTTLADIAASDTVKEKAPIVAEAAYSVASPLVRNIGTAGGNICQETRCWFFRYPHIVGGRLNCYRKGGDMCYAAQGRNRYHSIFGGIKAHTTPCTQECPGGTDIPAYMEQVRKGDIAGAAHTIMKSNPMPMITSRVCAHTCQTKCNRCENDEGVAISFVERYVGDYILAHLDDYYPKPIIETGKSVAIVGAGPAGLAAAFYLRQAGNNVTVYDNKEKAGGMLMYTIPLYRLPRDIVTKFTGVLEKMGVAFKLKTNIGNDLRPTELEKQYDSVFYATGAWKRPVIGIAGEELTEFGLDFLAEVNKWMESKINTEVLVTGGGNVAMDVAVTAKRLGAKVVTLACLEKEDEMPASKEEIARAREEGITILNGWGLSKVVSEDGKVQGMEVKRCVSVFDDKGHFSPKYDESEKMVISAGSILMAVGQTVDLSFLDEKYQIQLNRRGLITVDEETGATSRKGVFAGGDVTAGPSTVIRAILHGRVAATGMNRYLEVPDGGCCGKSESELKFVTYDSSAAQKETAAQQKEILLAERSLEKEDSFTLSAEDAKSEAGRCLNCSCYSSSPSDLAPALIAIDATIVTNKRSVAAEKFLCSKMRVSDFLEQGEIVERIEIPEANGAKMKYAKFRLREAIDFAIVSVAAALKLEGSTVKAVRIVLGGVAPIPIRADEAEGFLMGKKLTEANAEQAAELSVKGASPLAENEFKIIELKALMKKTLLELAK
jgi:NADPH-dependent glutamate synthase beta subunit-like oxidoreductase